MKKYQLYTLRGCMFDCRLNFLRIDFCSDGYVFTEKNDEKAIDRMNKLHKRHIEMAEKALKHTNKIISKYLLESIPDYSKYIYRITDDGYEKVEC